MENEIDAIYECEITLDKAHGWARLVPVPPAETLDDARCQGLAYLEGWPNYILRVIKKTTETVWVKGENDG